MNIINAADSLELFAFLILQGKISCSYAENGVLRKLIKEKRKSYEN
jgi:hypothetical protein